MGIALAVCFLAVALTLVFFPKVRAAVSPKKSEVSVVCDLDAILTQTVGFRFDGKIYAIPPLRMEQFILAVQSLAELDALKNAEKLDAGRLLDAYEKLFTLVCPEITRELIQSMGHQRISALLNLIIETIMGKATLAAEKKNPTSLTEGLPPQPHPA